MLRISCVFVTLLCGFCVPLQAQTRLIFPRVIYQQGQFTGVAIANPTTSDAQVTLTAYNVDGSLFSAAGAVNPHIETIAAGRQYARVASQIFNPPASIGQGAAATRLWVEATSSVEGLTGFFLEGNQNEDYVDGADLAGSGTDLIVPLIENVGASTTEISIVNPDSTAANITVDFLRGNGSVASSQTATVPALGALQGPLSVLFNISYADVLALRVRSDRPVLVYAIIFRQTDLSTVAVAGQNTALPAATLYFPQLAQGQAGSDLWNTSIGLVNLTSAQIQVRISAYQADGALFGPPIVTTNPASVLIGPGAVYRADVKTLFGFSNPLQVGWIKVETSTPALAGYVEYGAGTNRALVAAQLEPYLRSIFSHQAQGAGYFTGLAVLNASSLAANVEVTSLTQAGAVVGKAQRVVQPGQRISQLIQEWIPLAAGVVGGSVFVKSSLPTVATQLFGKVNFSALANVPPQEVTTGFDPGAALSTLTVTPPLAVLETGKPRQFTALGSTGVIWKVNGVAGGNATVGTISSTGLYTAPAIAPAPNTLTLEAATGDGAQSAGASVDVVQRETLTAGLTLVTAVAYLENLHRFFVAEQQVLSSVVIGGAPRATVNNTIITEQLPSGAGSSFTQIANETVGKMLPFVDGDGTSSYLLLAGTDGGKIYRVRVSDKQIVTVATGLNKPNSMTLDPLTGDLLVSEQGNNQITVVSKSQFDPTPDSIVAPRPGGGHWPADGTSRVISVTSPQGIAVDDCSGAIYVTTANGTLLEYLGDRVRTVASGLTGPNEILALYRDGAGCDEALTLMICESNRVVQITPETGEKHEFVGGLSNAVDLVFFPDGSPFVSDGDDALAVAEGPPGLGVSKISKVRMRRLYKRFGPIRIAGVPVFGARLPYRDPVGDNFQPAPVTAQNSVGRFLISPVSGHEIVDLVAITGAKVAGAVVLTFYFRDIVTPFAAGRRNGLAGFIDFDLGPDSGIPSHANPFNPFRTGAGLGIDAFIDFSTGLLHDIAGNRTLPVPMHFVRNTVSVRIPEVLLKLLPALMTVVVGNRHEITDVAPNARFILLDLDEVAVRTVQFTREELSGLESLTAPTVRVVLSNVSPDTIRVNYTATGGTATGGGDYTLLAGTLTFKPGETFKDLPLAIVNDSISEPDETILITLSSPFNATLGFRASHTYRIVDDDGTPRVAFALPSSSGAESVSPVTLVVNLSNSAAGPATVNYSVTGGTAAGGGVDFTLATGTLGFAPGETSKNIVFNIVNDASDEPDETIVVTLSSPTANLTLVGNTSHTYTIVDDDPTPTIAFAAGSSSGGESSTPVALVVNLSNPAGTTATVNYAVTGGSAANGPDYTLAGGTLSFAPGETSRSISIPIVNDTTDEPDETIVVTLSSPSANVNLSGNTVHTYSIVDDDPTPAVAFSSASSSGGESVSPIALVVNLSNPASTTATISYAVTGGTALGGGGDYTLTGGTLTFAPGETSKTISATIVNDLVDESNETIVVTLSSPSGNIALGGNTTHTYTILDDDPSPTVSFALSSSSAPESTTSVSLDVRLSAVSGQGVTVNYAVTGGTATSGSDYTLSSGVLTFSAGETSKAIIFTVINDGIDEPSETLIIGLSSPANANLGTNTSHTYSILDDDPPPTVSFALSSSSALESTTSVNLSVLLSIESAFDVTVNYAATTAGTATNGTDYTLSSGVLTFKVGETSKLITFTVTNDTLDEFDETVVVTLSAPTNATLGAITSHTYTILDNDAAPTVAFTLSSSSGSESILAPTITVVLSAASGKTVTVNYAHSGGTAIAGSDFRLTSGTFTFTPGQTSKTIPLTIINDGSVENNETVIIDLSLPINATLAFPSRHTYTILDNDILF